MKVLLINGSPDSKGCISTALKESAKILNAEGIETEEVFVGNKAIRGCIACRRCKETGKCIFDDLVNETAPKLAEADGIIVGTLVYFSNPTAPSCPSCNASFSAAGWICT